jgi:hypothetical protein
MKLTLDRVKLGEDFTVGKLSADGKTSSGDTYNIDNSKKSSSSVTPSSTSMASAYNYDIINLLLDRVTNPDIRTT